MIYLDNGYGVSEKSLAFFREHKHLVGEIESIKMIPYTNTEIIYPFKVVGDVGEIWLSGCTAGYGGEGPRATIDILKELGYPDEACDVVYKNCEFTLGPPSRWRPTPLPKRIPRFAEESAEEVLDFIRDYYAKSKIMPTAGEIKAGCDSITSVSKAHDRLYILRDHGYIHIRHRRHRGIVLL